ncbi:uncharacterized protein N7482_008954 [Penicillium canariense]|uniref:C2H2-type domain-containing protein n=1 Tax=Penicillium canariense TaxID=189055 RepID=A0A9W9HX06_9EURO|nr:uncharacterized protein N7482_008954 [Penicillium canariense]KAJ5157854.1 hypothetical protein N7482_008954 [Penicillium canariense]
MNPSNLTPRANHCARVTPLSPMAAAGPPPAPQRQPAFTSVWPTTTQQSQPFVDRARLTPFMRIPSAQYNGGASAWPGPTPLSPTNGAIDVAGSVGIGWMPNGNTHPLETPSVMGAFGFNGFNVDGMSGAAGSVDFQTGSQLHLPAYFEVDARQGADFNGGGGQDLRLWCGWIGCRDRRGFTREDCLMRHIRSTHISPDLFKCTQCTKAFGRLDKLRDHLCLRHGWARSG